jgi:IclR family transcriptional regulator, KDG regulon repressor
MKRKRAMALQRIESVAKALTILKLFKTNKTKWGVTEIARELDMQKSTVYRLLTTMQEFGFVRKNEDGSAYSLGLSLFELGSVVSNNFNFRDIAVSYMHKLAEQCGETVHLGIFSDHEVISIEAVETQSSLKSTVIVGERAPLYCTGIGKSLLAFLPGNEREQIIKNIHFEKFTEQTIVDPQKLAEELKLIRKRGFAVDNEEHDLGIICVGAPIFDFSGAVLGSLSISGPSVRITPEQMPRYIELVLTTAKAVSRDLGHREARENG